MFRVLGGVAVDVGGTTLELRGRERELVGILLARRDRPTSTDELVELLWGDTPPKTAAKTVHVLVGRVRRSLTEMGEPAELATTPTGYQLLDPVLDVDEWTAAIGAIRDDAVHDPQHGLEAIEGALSGFTGRPWAELGDAPWVRTQAGELEEQRRRVEELWADLALRVGGDLPIERFRKAADAEPLRERRWAQLMLALYRSGRQSDALRAYEEARQLLIEQIGVEPGPELRQLQLAILHHRVLPDQQQPLTAHPTSFVGRDDELVALDRALAQSRVVTITGIGGVGKTRLAAEHAHRRRLDGGIVRWAALGPVHQPDRLAAHVASELGLLADESASPQAVVAAMLGDDPALLVLDAAEGSSEAVAELVIRLLDQCARLRVLVTSRVGLGIDGEHVLPLDPLPLPSTDGPAAGTVLQLALDRLGMDDAHVDDDTRRRLLSVCADAGGIPLVVELLLAGPDDRIPTRVAGGHQAVMRDAIGHALADVDEGTARLAGAMSPYPAGVSERFAAALGGCSLEVARRQLRSLARVRIATTRAGVATLRYRSLDPVREVLVQASPASADDLRVVGDEFRTVFHELRPPGHPLRIGRLDAVEDEHDNLRYLLVQQLEADPDEALRLAIPACEFWPIRGHIVEGRAWLERGLATADPDGPLRWRAVFALARTTRTFAEVAELRTQLESGVAQATHDEDDVLILGTGLMYLAMARGWQGDAAGAADATLRAREIDRVAGTPWTTAQLDHLDALGLALAGDLVGCREGQRAFARRMEELDDPVSAAMGWYLAATIGDMAGATDLSDELTMARRLAEGHGDVALLGQILRVEARLRSRLGDPASTELFDQAADQLAEQGAPRAAALARLDRALLLLDTDAAAAGAVLGRAVPVLLDLDPAAAALGLAAVAALASDQGRPTDASAIARTALDLADAAPATLDRSQMERYLDGITPSEGVDRSTLVQLVAAATAAPRGV